MGSTPQRNAQERRIAGTATQPRVELINTRSAKRYALLPDRSPRVCSRITLRTADETDLYNGSLNRYNWEYPGLQKFLIHYNNYRITQQGTDYERILQQHHVNPELRRWERQKVPLWWPKLEKTQRL